MAYLISDIAAALEAEAFGAVSLEVSGLAEPSEAGRDELALAMNPKFADGLKHGQARAAVIWEGADWQDLGLEAAIVIPRPRYAMAGLTELFADQQRPEPGIHPTAVIDATAKVGEGATIGPFVVVGEGARIGANAMIDSHVSIGPNVVIGTGARLFAGARIHRGARIGDNFTLHHNGVIGSDGFSFVTPDKSTMEQVRENLGTAEEKRAQAWVRIHSLGGVEIGDNVEVGACATIDQGTIRATRIGSGTKVDNHVHVGHNVTVGQDCLLCGFVAVAGSSKVGDRVVMGGQSGLTDNAFIGDDAVIGAGTKLLSSVPAGSAMLGYPGVKMETHIEIYKASRRLPRLARDVRTLQKDVSKLKDND